MKLWLDDERDPREWIGPDWDIDWCWAKNYDEAIVCLRHFDITYASLDNDLGLDSLEGYKVVHWMIENNVWPVDGVNVHSANPVASQRMRQDIERYGPY
jgi:hypothetical protein